jgi:four helix bundle protein
MENEDFGFKNLIVWQKAVDFADHVIELTEHLNTSGIHYRLIEQIDASSASVSQNITEEKGRNSKKEFKQYIYFSGILVWDCNFA